MLSDLWWSWCFTSIEILRFSHPQVDPCCFYFFVLTSIRFWHLGFYVLIWPYKMKGFLRMHNNITISDTLVVKLPKVWYKGALHSNQNQNNNIFPASHTQRTSHMPWEKNVQQNMTFTCFAIQKIYSFGEG